MTRFALLAIVLGGCGPEPRREEVGDATSVDARSPAIDAVEIDALLCSPPPNAAGPETQLAPEFANLYKVYDLGPVPGVPNPLGGATIDAADSSRLLIAGASERPDGGIYAIGLERNPCGHIVGFVGTAQHIAAAPNVDANLVYKDPSLLVYAEWPLFQLSQLPTGAAGPARQTDLRPLGVDASGDSGPGGVGLVPLGLAAAGQLRIVTWPAGRWYHVATTPDGALLAIDAVGAPATTIPNNPGGFAYVPAGSPGFTNQAIMVAEWRTTGQTEDRVAVYDADPMGDPIVSTRREFMSRFTRPWGAYFEPVTGDYMFLQWGTSVDRVYIVQGFVPPPPIF